MPLKGMSRPLWRVFLPNRGRRKTLRSLTLNRLVGAKEMMTTPLRL